MDANMTSAPNPVDQVLNERGKRYSPWATQCVSQHNLKNILRTGANYNNLRVAQKEALDMMMVKISRIIEGEHSDDNWVDLVGYATLGMQHGPNEEAQ